MEEMSLIEFLKIEINCFRELLSSFIAEELAYKEGALTRLVDIFILQKQIFEELKTKRPKKFQPFNLKNDIDHSLLHNLKDQLDTLIHKVHSQFQRNLYIKTLTPQPQEAPAPTPKRQVITETPEDECKS
jgi:hypothetical protein